MLNDRSSQLDDNRDIGVVEVSALSEIIRGRTTVKAGFVDKPVSQELVLSLLDDAVWAPTHKTREPWRFIFVGADRKEAFIDAVLECQVPTMHDNTRRKMGDTPSFLVAVMNSDPRQKVWEEDFAATSCLLQNFQLLAWEKDLGVCWKTPEYIHDPVFRKGIGVEPGEKIVGILHVGYYDEEIVGRRKRERTDAQDKFTAF